MRTFILVTSIFLLNNCTVICQNIHFGIGKSNFYEANAFYYLSIDRNVTKRLKIGLGVNHYSYGKTRLGRSKEESVKTLRYRGISSSSFFQDSGYGRGYTSNFNQNNRWKYGQYGLINESILFDFYSEYDFNLFEDLEFGIIVGVGISIDKEVSDILFAEGYYISDLNHEVIYDDFLVFSEVSSTYEGICELSLLLRYPILNHFYLESIIKTFWFSQGGGYIVPSLSVMYEF